MLAPSRVLLSDVLSREFRDNTDLFTSRSSLRSTALFPAARHSAAYCTVRAACVRKGWLEVAGRSGSAGMLVLVTARSSAATFPVARVDSVSPVARRAGMLRSLTDGAGAGEWGGPGRNRSVGLASRSQWTGRRGRFGSRRSAAPAINCYKCALTMSQNVVPVP